MLKIASLIEPRKAILSLILGLAGFAGAFFAFNFSSLPITITLLWSYIFPLIAGMAFGARYGFLAGFLGLGAFFSFFIWPTNGWANAVNVLLYLGWFVSQGLASRMRAARPSHWNHPFMVQMGFSFIYVAGIILLYPLTMALSPPSWVPDALRSLPLATLLSISAKGMINMWMVLIAAVSVLAIPAARRLLVLPNPPYSKDNSRIFLISLLSGGAIWVVYLVFDSIFIDQNFPGGVFTGILPEEMMALVLFLTTSLLFGYIVAADGEQRLKAELALKGSEDRFRSLVESSNDWVWEVDQVGACISSSDHCRGILGYSPDELIGKPASATFHPDDAPQIRQRLVEVGARREPIRGMVIRHVAKDGHPVILEMNAAPFFDERGGFMGYRGMSRDITSRIQVEKALRDTEEKFSVAFQASPIGNVLIAYRTGQFVDVNESFVKIFGYTWDEVIGHGAVELGMYVNNEDDRVVDQILRVDGKIKDQEYHFRTRAGQSVLCRVSGEIVDIGGEPFALLSVVDVTRLKHAEEEIIKLNSELEMRVMVRTAQLVNANKELESFSYTISHDLRAPLRAINGFSLELRDQYSDVLDTTGLHYLDVIRRNSVKMDQFINDLLAFSKIGRQDIQKTEIDMTGMVTAVYAELRSAIPEREINLKLFPLPPAMGDSAMIRQVWVNLVSNALKFTATCSPAEIEVGSRRENGQAHYYIHDNGVGFDPSYADRLFRVFQRLHNTPDFEGTGVGLAIVSRIVRKHGGDVTAEGKVNGGANFTFYL